MSKRKSFYELINALRLHEAFKLEMKSFTNQQVFYVYKKFDAFKLETKSFYDLTS